MTDKSNEQEKIVIDSLPKLEGDPHQEKATDGNKKPPVVFIIGLMVLVVAVIFSIQYVINYLGLFDQETPVIEEPSIPVFSEEVMDSSSPSGNDFLVNDAGSVSDSSMDDHAEAAVETQSQRVQTVETDLSLEQLNSIHDALAMLIEKVEVIAGQLNEQQGSDLKLIHNQTTLMKQLEMEVARRKHIEAALTDSIKENQRWLGGISNQLKEIGVEMKEESQAFPIVVYSQNVWGDDVFLIVAQKNTPEQTSFLRVGEIVGRWRLIEITEGKALFEHVEGNTKEVIL